MSEPDGRVIACLGCGRQDVPLGPTRRCVACERDEREDIEGRALGLRAHTEATIDAHASYTKPSGERVVRGRVLPHGGAE